MMLIQDALKELAKIERERGLVQKAAISDALKAKMLEQLALRVHALENLVRADDANPEKAPGKGAKTS